MTSRRCGSRAGGWRDAWSSSSHVTHASRRQQRYLTAALLGGLEAVMPRLVAAPRIIIVACGTSWHAGILGEEAARRHPRRGEGRAGQG